MRRFRRVDDYGVRRLLGLRFAAHGERVAVCDGNDNTQQGSDGGGHGLILAAAAQAAPSPRAYDCLDLTSSRQRQHLAQSIASCAAPQRCSVGFRQVASETPWLLRIFMTSDAIGATPSSPQNILKRQSEGTSDDKDMSRTFST